MPKTNCAEPGVGTGLFAELAVGYSIVFEPGSDGQATSRKPVQSTQVHSAPFAIR